jgi:hypothetical protein
MWQPENESVAESVARRRGVSWLAMSPAWPCQRHLAAASISLAAQLMA